MTTSTWPRAAERYQQYVRKLQQCGHWIVRGRDSRQHVVLEHVETGETIAYATHQGGSDANSARNFAAQAQRICGCSIIEHRNRRRSRKADQCSGFSLEAAKREQRGFHASWDERIERLHARHDELVQLAHRLASKRTASALHECAGVLAQIADVERELTDDFHQPVERFDPYELRRYA